MKEWTSYMWVNIVLIILIGFCCWLFHAWQPLIALIFLGGYKPDFCPHCGKELLED